MKILISSLNKNKVSELLKILPKASLSGSLSYLSLKDFPEIPEIKETGATLAANASIKARVGSEYTGLIAIADDSGLAVDVLDGAPGIYSARYAFPDRTDYEANNEKLLHELRGLPLRERSARFMTVAALAMPNGETILREGVIEGFIAEEPDGSNGFGYDSLFIVKGLNKTMAQLAEDEKNQISHRALAFKNLIKVINML